MDQSIYGTAQFKIKHRVTELRVAPGATTSVLGTLRKGAVVTIISDENRYYYKVRLDNGLEGYVYKPAGEITNGATPSRMPAIEEASESSFSSNGNGASPLPPAGSAMRRSTVSDRVGTYRNGNGNGNGSKPTVSSSNGNGTMPRSGSGRALVVSSAEIAVFDRPGIVGKQVAKLKRGDQVTMIGQDSFFYQVALPNGTSGYIPRYSADLS